MAITARIKCELLHPKNTSPQKSITGDTPLKIK
jgi:hypothetical protein